MELTIRTGTLADAEQFISLLREVRQGMPHKEWVYLDPPEEVRQMMMDRTMELWVAMDGEQMAAAFDILHPGLASFNYGYDLELAELDLTRVVNMDTVAVRQPYRGMGLHKQLMQIVEEELARRGSQILLCTVHPENHFSLNNFLALGYSIERKLQKYGSVRYILRKELL